MKRSTIIAGLMGLLATSVELSSQSKWEYVAPFPPKRVAYSAVVAGPRAYFWCGNNIVFSTADGGLTYKVCTPYGPVKDVALGSEFTVQGIAFADSLIGYVTDVAHGEFRTTNGGESWTQMSLGYGTSIILSVFGSSSVGWKFESSYVIKTTNAGASWISGTTPFDFNGRAAKAWALDAQRVWFARSDFNGGGNGGGIWYSSDGGDTWQKNLSAPYGMGSQYVAYYDLRINPSGVGVATGYRWSDPASIQTFVSRTSNFGVSWSTYDYPLASPTSLLSISDSVWLIIGGGSSPKVWKSTNAGGTWSVKSDPFPPSPSTAYQSVGASVYIPAYNAVVVSTIGGMYRSTNSGDTFVRVNGSMDEHVQDIHVEEESVDPAHQMLVVTMTRKYQRSEDAGVNWTSIVNPGSYLTFSRMAVTKGMIYVSPDQSSIYRSSDKGETWMRLEHPGYGTRGLDAYDGKYVSVQGSDVLNTSSDQGKTWTSRPLPGDIWFRESRILGPGEVVAAGIYFDTSGQKGMFYRTTDGGTEWKIQRVKEDVERLSMVTATTGYATSATELYKTSDGGSTWVTAITSSTYPYYGYGPFIFADSAHGLLRRSFDFLETTNGGATWTSRELVLPMYSVVKLVRTTDGTLLAVGDGMLWRLPASSGMFSVSKDTSFAEPGVPRAPSVHAYPNPFNPSTTLVIDLQQSGHVRVRVFDILGREVRIVADGMFSTGAHKLVLDGSGLPSGVYIAVVETGGNLSHVKLLMMK